jgi:hypothetical protein
MADFNVSKPWVILTPAPAGASANKGAEELSRIIDLLRRQAGLTLPSPAILNDAAQPVPKPSSEAAEFVLNHTTGPAGRSGFAWRAGASRIEIYGNSPRGLYKGLFSFLAALGIRWPESDRETLPPANPGSPGVYRLAAASAREQDVADPALRKRFLLPPGQSRKTREAAIIRAARNGFDALVVPLEEFPLKGKDRALTGLAAQYALDIEAGGREFSSLVPRRFFFFHPALFRMEEGRRKKEGFFCATNPDTLALIQKNAARLFTKANAAPVPVTIFHLWPEQETRWCSCPSCRAFSPEEQNRIAINAAADALKEINPQALLSYYEPLNETEAYRDTTENSDTVEQTGYIEPRPNTFRITGGDSCT